MKKLIFMLVLLMAFAIPTWANDVDVGIGGAFGKYCHIEGAGVTVDLGAPDYIGTVSTPNTAIVTTNTDATINVAVKDGKLVGDTTGHEMPAYAAWAVGPTPQAVIPPETNSIHAYNIVVTRNGYKDLADAYHGVVNLSIICNS